MNLVVFDLDGVLVDTVDFWLALMNRCAQISGHPPVSRDRLERSWGQSTAADTDEFYPGWSATQVHRFYAEHSAEYADLIHPDAAVVAVAQRARALGARLGVVTNSPRGFATLALGRCGLAPDMVVTADDVCLPKPDPEGLLVVCATLGIEPGAAVFVGDSGHDRAAARAAGIRYLDVSTPGLGALVSTCARGHAVAPPHWDLTDLETLPDGTRAGLDELLDRASALPDARSPEGEDTAALMRRRGEVDDLLGRARAIADLRWATAVTDPTVLALRDRAEVRAAAVEARFAAFDERWCALPADRAAELLAAPDLAPCRDRLRRLRAWTEHRLGAEAERVLAETEITGVGAWRRLHHVLDARARVDLDGEPMPLDAAADRLTDPDRARRGTALERVSAALATDADLRAYVLDAVVRDHATRDRLRGHPHWLTGRLRADELSPAGIEALAATVDAHQDLARRWYRVKAAALGLHRLADQDRQAPLGPPGPVLDWVDAQTLVSGGYHALHPRLGAAAERFFTGSWIDAAPGPGRRGGAFCSFTVPSVHPYVLVNWRGTEDDVVTLAHELGHGVHGLLARDAGIHHYTVPEALAEAVAQAGETAVLRHRLDTAPTDAARFAAVATLLDRTVSVVWRLRALWRFEEDVHSLVRRGERLDADRLGELWLARLSNLFGDTVELSEGQRYWWARVPHFVEVPGYLHTYVWGQLLATAIVRRAEEDGDAVVELLRTGGSAPTSLALGSAGVDPGCAETWREAVAEVQVWVARAEELVRRGLGAAPPRSWGQGDDDLRRARERRPPSGRFGEPDGPDQPRVPAPAAGQPVPGLGV